MIKEELQRKREQKLRTLREQGPTIRRPEIRRRQISQGSAPSSNGGSRYRRVSAAKIWPKANLNQEQILKIVNRPYENLMDQKQMRGATIASSNASSSTQISFYPRDPQRTMTASTSAIKIGKTKTLKKFDTRSSLPTLASTEANSRPVSQALQRKPTNNWVKKPTKKSISVPPSNIVFKDLNPGYQRIRINREVKFMTQKIGAKLVKDVEDKEEQIFNEEIENGKRLSFGQIRGLNKRLKDNYIKYILKDDLRTNFYVSKQQENIDETVQVLNESKSAVKELHDDWELQEKALDEHIEKQARIMMPKKLFDKLNMQITKEHVRSASQNYALHQKAWNRNFA